MVLLHIFFKFKFYIKFSFNAGTFHDGRLTTRPARPEMFLMGEKGVFGIFVG